MWTQLWVTAIEFDHHHFIGLYHTTPIHSNHLSLFFLPSSLRTEFIIFNQLLFASSKPLKHTERTLWGSTRQAQLARTPSNMLTLFFIHHQTVAFIFFFFLEFSRVIRKAFQYSLFDCTGSIHIFQYLLCTFRPFLFFIYGGGHYWCWKYASSAVK